MMLSRRSEWRHQSTAARSRTRRPATRVTADTEEPSARNADRPAGGADHHRLAGTVRAKQPEEDARRHAPAQPVQRLRPVAVDVRQPFDEEGGATALEIDHSLHRIQRGMPRNTPAATIVDQERKTMKPENDNVRHSAARPVEPEYAMPGCDTGPLGRLRFVVGEFVALVRRRR